VAAAWHAVTSGKQWRSDEAAYGFVLVDDHKFVAPDGKEKSRKPCAAELADGTACGRKRGEHEQRIPWVRVVEVTSGKHGWHVHVHTLMLWKRDSFTSTADWIKVAEHVAGRMYGRWERKVKALGFDCTEKGFDVRGARLRPGGNALHEYLVKLSNEVTGGMAKLAKDRGRTPFQILGDLLASGGEVGRFEADLELWHEWEAGSHGRRQTGWSGGLREWAVRYGAKLSTVEKSDEDIANESLQTTDGLVIAPKSWHRGLANNPGRQCEFLETVEAGGYEAAAAKLDSWGLSYIAKYDESDKPSPPDDVDERLATYAGMMALARAVRARR
jgi:hypothetical protein